MMAKTLKAVAVVGVNKGYSGENAVQNALQIATRAWQDSAKQVFEDTQIYVSAVAEASKTIYHTDWGCPAGGEDTVSFSSSANPAFVADLEAWKESVLSVVRLVKSELQQSTVVVEFVEINDFVYLV